MTMADRKSTHVVMTSNTYDAQIGDVVAVTAEQADRLIANGHARATQPGEVKAATEGK
jgi:hypothetical protein